MRTIVMFTRDLHLRRRSRSGFSLVESILAMTLMLIAGAAMLLAVDTAVLSTDTAMEEMIAQGIARQIMDEVVGNRYKSVGASPYQYPLTADSWGKSGNGRERFDDIADFNGFTADNAEDRWGQPLGTGDGEGGLRHTSLRAPIGQFNGWRQSIDVYYVDNSDVSSRLSAGKTSKYRAVEVVIERQRANGDWHELARMRRVVAYVPST